MCNKSLTRIFIVRKLGNVDFQSASKNNQQMSIWLKAMQNIINKWWTQISIGILVLGALWIWWSAAPPGGTPAGVIPAPQEGFLAPDFELVTLDGEMISLTEMRGKAVLLNF